MDSVCSLTSRANRHVGMENRSWVDGEPRQAAFGLGGGGAEWVPEQGRWVGR